MCDSGFSWLTTDQIYSAEKTVGGKNCKAMEKDVYIFQIIFK